MQRTHQEQITDRRRTQTFQSLHHAYGGSIVVGVDGSPASEAAVSWAAQEASLKGCGLLLIQVRPKLLGSDDPGAWHFMPARLTTRVADHFGIPVDGLVHSGGVVDTLTLAARGAQALVVGQADPRSAEPIRLGQPLASRCAQLVSCPVVTVPALRGTPAPAGKVVIALDSSPDAWAGLNWGVTEARVRRCACELVHVSDAVGPASIDHVHARSVALALLDRAVEYAAYCGVAARGSLLTAPTASALREATLYAALLVLGGTSHGSIDRLLHRSITADCLNRCTCAVAIVTARRPHLEGDERAAGSCRHQRRWTDWPVDLPEPPVQRR